MAYNGLYGMELWRSDGTVAGTVMAQDFNEDYTASLDASNPMGLINGRLAVVVKTLDYGREMWISPAEAVSTPGDYDVNGIVDGSDFLAWQRGFGSAATPAGSGADGDGSGAIDAGDLRVWAEHFGEGSLGSGVAADAAVSAAMSAAVVEMAEVEEFAPVDLAAVEDAVAGDEFFAKPRAAGSRSLIALAQGAFGMEDSRARSAAVKAIVRADDAEEIPHVRAKSALSRDAALADWTRETQRSWSLSRERLTAFDGDEESPLEFNWHLAHDSGWTPS
jgi:ELWxxDGT repeat protein